MSRRKLIEKAGAVLSRERGTVFKDPGGKINICLVYPNTYRVGMSNLGFQGVYGMLNSYPDVVCERAFLPDAEDLRQYEDGTELLALESKRPLNRFDIVAFSVPFENDYPNILKILNLARIEPRAALRNGGPLLTLGGVCAFSNPEPLASFFDVVFVGEAEPLIPEFLDRVRNSPAGKHGLLKSLLGVDGLYVPSFYKISHIREALEGAPLRIKRRFAKSAVSLGMRHSITTPDTEFAGMRLVEMMRGCPWDCAFCLAGKVYNPPRARKTEDILEEVEEALSKGERVGLIGPSISDFQGIVSILDKKDVEFSITSLRAGKKSIGMLPYLKRHKTLSIAAEAGTERLRQVIKKKISEQDIIETGRAILGNGMGLRIYFMVGLPTETMADIEGIPVLVNKIKEGFSGGRISVTVSLFIPKPFTCFERAPMERPESVKEKLKYLKKALSGMGVAIFHDVIKYSYMQGVFALGGRELAAVLELMGKGMDYKAAMKEAGLSEEDYIFKERTEEILPWGFIDAG
ncbi:MAG: radical SAM protein [Nitrospiraceae bacterium]|nr:radical SAM protein [Nitrospiraceae bacterium]